MCTVTSFTAVIVSFTYFIYRSGHVQLELRIYIPSVYVYICVSSRQASPTNVSHDQFNNIHCTKSNKVGHAFTVIGTLRRLFKFVDDIYQR